LQASKPNQLASSEAFFLSHAMFQEFPKCIYRGEEYVVVFNAEEEAEKQKEGYGVPEEKAEKRKPGRPRKVEQ